MTPKKPTAAMQAILDILKETPDASYADIRDATAAQGIKVYPIMYGRALALLGLVEVAPRGSKKLKKDELSRAAGDNAADTIESMVSSVRKAEQERARYKAALLDIASRIRRVLDEKDE